MRNHQQTTILTATSAFKAWPLVLRSYLQPQLGDHHNKYTYIHTCIYIYVYIYIYN